MIKKTKTFSIIIECVALFTVLLFLFVISPASGDIITNDNAHAYISSQKAQLKIIEKEIAILQSMVNEYDRMLEKYEKDNNN